MNPGFINDGVDMVEVNAGQKAAAEDRRLAHIMANAGMRSSSMPPLSMPPRIMHGNVSHAVPAMIVNESQFARPIYRASRERSVSSSDPHSSDSTSSSAPPSTDSGCENRRLL